MSYEIKQNYEDALADNVFVGIEVCAILVLLLLTYYLIDMKN